MCSNPLLFLSSFWRSHQIKSNIFVIFNIRESKCIAGSDDSPYCFGRRHTRARETHRFCFATVGMTNRMVFAIAGYRSRQPLEMRQLIFYTTLFFLHRCFAISFLYRWERFSFCSHRTAERRLDLLPLVSHRAVAWRSLTFFRSADFQSKNRRKKCFSMRNYQRTWSTSSTQNVRCTGCANVCVCVCAIRRKKIFPEKNSRVCVSIRWLYVLFVSEWTVCVCE